MSMTLLVVLLMAGWCTVSVCVLGWLYWLPPHMLPLTHSPGLYNGDQYSLTDFIKLKS